MIQLKAPRFIQNRSRLLTALLFTSQASGVSDERKPESEISVTQLGEQLQIGDVIFIRLKAPPCKKIAEATGSWTNHVGIVIDVKRGRVAIAESTFPFSRISTLKRFVAQSERGRIAVMRLKNSLTESQREEIIRAARRRTGKFYDTGFDLHSRRQFCSRFVYEILEEAAGVRVAETETFEALLARYPDVDQQFWKLWYFGKIPWQRETVTPAGILESPFLHPVFDGTAKSRLKTLLAG